jgi:hypothetical protein
MPYLVKNTGDKTFKFTYKKEEVELLPGEQILTDLQFPSKDLVRGRRENKCMWSFVGLFKANQSGDLHKKMNSDGEEVVAEDVVEVAEEVAAVTEEVVEVAEEVVVVTEEVVEVAEEVVTVTEEVVEEPVVEVKTTKSTKKGKGKK